MDPLHTIKGTVQPAWLPPSLEEVNLRKHNKQTFKSLHHHAKDPIYLPRYFDLNSAFELTVGRVSGSRSAVAFSTPSFYTGPAVEQAKRHH